MFNKKFHKNVAVYMFNNIRIKKYFISLFK